MKQFFECFFAALFLLLSASAASAQSSMRVVVFGDSLVSGYHLEREQAFAARLEQKMRDIGYTGVTVSNAAIDGQTTANAIDRINVVTEQQPDVVIVAFGTDDLARGVAVEQIYTNLAFIVGKLTQSRTYVVIAGVKAPPALGYSIVKQFESMYKLVANLHKSLLIPDITEKVTGNPALTMADEIHPNDRGVDAMVEDTYRYVDTCLRTKIQMLQYQQQYKAYQQDLVGSR